MQHLDPEEKGPCMLQYTSLYEVSQVAAHQNGLNPKFLVECIHPPQWNFTNNEPQRNCYGLKGGFHESQ